MKYRVYQILCFFLAFIAAIAGSLRQVIEWFVSSLDLTQFLSRGTVKSEVLSFVFSTNNFFIIISGAFAGVGLGIYFSAQSGDDLAKQITTILDKTFGRTINSDHVFVKRYANKTLHCYHITATHENREGIWVYYPVFVTQSTPFSLSGSFTFSLSSQGDKVEYVSEIGLRNEHLIAIAKPKERQEKPSTSVFPFWNSSHRSTNCGIVISQSPAGGDSVMAVIVSDHPLFKNKTPGVLSVDCWDKLNNIWSENFQCSMTFSVQDKVEELFPFLGYWISVSYAELNPLDIALIKFESCSSEMVMVGDLIDKNGKSKKRSFNSTMTRIEGNTIRVFYKSNKSEESIGAGVYSFTSIASGQFHMYRGFFNDDNAFGPVYVHAKRISEKDYIDGLNESAFGPQLFSARFKQIISELVKSIRC